MKHRTQILLDPPQYQFLRSLAQKEKRGIGAMIRDWIDEKRNSLNKRPPKKDPLMDLIGSCKDSVCNSENYKDYLYGHKK